MKEGKIDADLDLGLPELQDRLDRIETIAEEEIDGVDHGHQEEGQDQDL